MWTGWLIQPAGGAFGTRSGAPASAVVFAMLGAAMVKTVIRANSAAPPNPERPGIQVALGIVLGLQFSLEPLARAGSLVVSLAVSLVLIILSPPIGTFETLSVQDSYRASGDREALWTGTG